MTSVTLIVLCEGATERNFVVQTIAPHLREQHVYAKAINLGGSQSTASLHWQVNNALKAKREHEYVTTMLDLYALSHLPGHERVEGESPRQRVTRLEEALFSKFPNPNFIPYIQLHEFEALVLAEIEKIPVAFPDGEATSRIAQLRASIGGQEPELVDEGKETAPSKRIIKAIPAYRAAKSSAGPEIAAEIGLDTLRTRCPHFGEWLTRLEELKRES